MSRLLFFGTSTFAIPSLATLLRDGSFDIVALVTQPDRPVGRHAELTPPPTKGWLQSNHPNIPIIQPDELKDKAFQTWIKEIGSTCDAFVVVSYGKILPQWLLDLPKHGVINVHGSLLPRWRGASPIQAAIAVGDQMSGVTIMRMDADLDHGPILALSEEPIDPTDTGGSLHDRLADLGGAILPGILKGYLDGTIQPQDQEHNLATTCRTLTRNDGRLTPSTQSAEELDRLIRAYTPWPSTFFDIEGKRLKILSARIANQTQHPKQFILECANQTHLELLTVQPEGKRPMSGEEYIRGIAPHQN